MSLLFNIPLFLFAKSRLEELSGWTISWKRKPSGKKYLYRQFYRDGKRIEEYVRRKDEASVLAEFAEKQKMRQILSSLNVIYKSLTSAQQRNIREQIRLYPILTKKPDPPDKNWTADFLPLRSREEVIAYELLQRFGIEAEYEKPIDAYNPYSRRPDFTFQIDGKTYYWEHMGKLSDPLYRQSQIQKLREYKKDGIRVNENLIITTPVLYKGKTYLHVPRLLWQLVRLNLIPAKKVRQLYYASF